MTLPLERTKHDGPEARLRYATLLVASIALAGVVLTLTLWDRFMAALREPAGQNAASVMIIVEPSETWGELLPRLAERGVIRDVETASTYVNHLHDPHPIAPGEYAVSQAMSLAEVVAQLEAGQRIKRPVNIPAGTTVANAAALLDQAGIVNEAAFLAAAQDPALMARLGIKAGRAEGFLLPDVYAFARGSDAEAILSSMVGAFEGAYRRAVGDRTGGLSRIEIVTLASLIEQAPVPRKERPLFSALLRNRLRARIPLQIEAARAYAAQRPEANRADWDTYSKAGLPPGPICSPGPGALLAASSPATSRALYAVTRTDGSHVFCDDLDCLYEESRRYKRRLPRPLPVPLGVRTAAPMPRSSRPPPPPSEGPPPPPGPESP